MNRRTLLRGLFVAPVVAAVAPMIPRPASWSLASIVRPDGTLEHVSLSPVPMHPECRCVLLPDVGDWGITVHMMTSDDVLEPVGVAKLAGPVTLEGRWA